MTIKEKNMSEVKITKENLMKAYENGCDDVKSVFRDLFKGEFTEAWEGQGEVPCVPKGGNGLCSIEELHVPDTFDPNYGGQNDIIVDARVAIWAHSGQHFKIEKGILYIKESQ